MQPICLHVIGDHTFLFTREDGLDKIMLTPQYWAHLDDVEGDMIPAYASKILRREVIMTNIDYVCTLQLLTRCTFLASAKKIN